MASEIGERAPVQLDRLYPHQVLLRGDLYTGSAYQTLQGFCIGRRSPRAATRSSKTTRGTMRSAFPIPQTLRNSARVLAAKYSIRPEGGAADVGIC